MDSPPSPVSCANRPSFAPVFIALTAAAPSAPKLIAEMLSTDSEYGCVHCGPPTVTRRCSTGSEGIGCGATECIMNV